MRFTSSKLRRSCLTVAMAICSFLILAAVTPPPAQAMMVLGHHIVLGPNQSATTYRIKNTRDVPLGYRLQWMQLRQVPQGPRQKVAPGEIIPNVNSAEPHMFVSPRRMILQPGQLQHLRFMVRRSPDMVPGEYRSYIYLEPEELPDAFTGAGQESRQPRSGASGSLAMLTGYRIPVIFLHGETTLDIGITNARFGLNARGVGGLHFTFTRQGTRSAIGDLSIKCVNAEGETQVSSGAIKVFTELNEKDFFYPVQFPDTGCSALAVDFMPNKNDPDYVRGPVRLVMVPVQ